MRKLLLASIALMTVCGAVQAADVPRKMPVKAVPAPALAPIAP